MVADTLIDHALRKLRLARKVADYAEALGAAEFVPPPPTEPNHIGAVLADCILQAGVNYRTVVRIRIERILELYPEAATLSGTLQFVYQESVSEFLMWKHPEKIGRFVRLVTLLYQHRVEDTGYLRTWLADKRCREILLEVPGIGEKTVDYLCLLVGMNFIAVDRHVRTFTQNAGVNAADYEEVKQIVSYAADLLSIPRRDFDRWIWVTHSQSHNAVA